jgi:hypothetical protein
LIEEKFFRTEMVLSDSFIVVGFSFISLRIGFTLSVFVVEMH